MILIELPPSIKSRIYVYVYIEIHNIYYVNRIERKLIIDLLILNSKNKLFYIYRIYSPTVIN